MYTLLHDKNNSALQINQVQALLDLSVIILDLDLKRNKKKHFYYEKTMIKVNRDRS